ncbi:MAG TPA: 5-oxoprolinase/urea amidolyase family protein [Acidimicrobiales bacterium]|jgi:KipI family sensor histidine kinase inhibitor
MISRADPYGDSALLIEVDDVASAHGLAEAVERQRRSGLAPEGVRGAVVGFCSVVVHLEPAVEGAEAIERWALELADHGVGRGGPGIRPTPGSAPVRDRVDIPVTFDGPDLEAVAAGIGRSTASVIDQLTSTGLRVAFLGFAPGFPYLTGLPPELASIPRRSTPRTSVPAGSVAVGGGFATVYPQSTPGGWMLLGRTDLRLFDPDNPPFALLRPGDAVRFSTCPPPAPGDHTDQHPTRPPPDGAATGRARLAARGRRFVEVLDPGLLSLVEDGGRQSLAKLGIPGAGAADPQSLRLANRLVGNADLAAAIEVTAVGPKLRFAGDGHLAVVASAVGGVDVRIDDHSVGTDVVSPVSDGQIVSIGRIMVGLRAYVAVSGGIETPLVMGSRSSDLLCGLGPGPLMAGDQLDVGTATRPHGLASHPIAPRLGVEPAVIRVIGGPHRVHPSTLARLTSTVWAVGKASNRIGLRLEGDRQSPAHDSESIRSTPMVTGAIQIPPDGGPIVLMPDHATVGGYPVAACVITADLARLGQLRPGDALRFEMVDFHTARSEYLRGERELAGRVSGWFPTRAGT